MKRGNGFFFLIISIISCVPCEAKGGNPGFSIYRNNGFMWAHRKTMLQMEAPTNGFDLNLTFLTEQGKWNWPHNFNSPRIGICLTYLDLGTPDIAGKAFGILPYIEFKILNRPRQELNIRVGSGIGYVTRIWDLETNLQNKAVGSHVNANMRLHLVYHLLITPKFELSAVVGMTHFSNANYKMPNLGLNSVETGIGIGYLLNGKASETKKYIPDTSAHHSRHEIRLSTASKVTGLIYSKRIHVVELSYRYFAWCKQKSRISVGIDLFEDQGYLYRDNPADAVGKANINNSFETGLTVGRELNLGSLHIITEGGIYLFSPKWNKGLFYQRLGFKYDISKNLSASMTLKTHFARSDYIEWGIAYTILQP